MSEIVQFVRRADLDAKQNLSEFIRLARDDLKAFPSESSWSDNTWRHREVVIVFATKTMPLGKYKFTPFAEPFLQFSKAFIRYEYSHRPVVSLAFKLQALRCIEAALLDVHGTADILLLNGAVMDVSADRCKSFYTSNEVWHKTGLAMQKVFEFCREFGLAPALPLWRSPFKKPAILTEDLGEAGAQHRAGKLPTNDVMLKIADLFAQAVDAESRYFLSIMVLLMATPSRISEVLALSTNCIQWEEDGRGGRQMYLCWHAAKGKGAMKKWVVPAMHQVVEEAVRRLIEIGAPARTAARFAHENPGLFMFDQSGLVFQSHDQDEVLTPQDFASVMGLKGRKDLGGSEEETWQWSQMLGTKWIAALIKDKKPTYRDLAEHVRKTYHTHRWPYIDDASSTYVWDALCLHRENEFHKIFAVKYFSWRLPSQTEVNIRFDSTKGLSLFERAGLKNEDGSPIKLTTHQPRHWLSTMCERAGMDDHTLAQWAGRASTKDNRHYDHRTPEERLAVARQLLTSEPSTPLDKFKSRVPVTFEELGLDRLGTAKATLYGMCTHDYAMTPCQKQRECMTCKEHVCIKGDHVTLDRIKVLEQQTSDLLAKAQAAHTEGHFGADRWVDNHKWKLAHVRTMRVLLESPETPDGALLRIPGEHDPSAVRRTLMDLNMIEPPSAGQEKLSGELLQLLGGKDA